MKTAQGAAEVQIVEYDEFKDTYMVIHPEAGEIEIGAVHLPLDADEDGPRDAIGKTKPLSEWADAAVYGIG